MEVCLYAMKNIFIIFGREISLVVEDVQTAPSHSLIKQTNRNHAKVIAMRKLLNLVD